MAVVNTLQNLVKTGFGSLNNFHRRHGRQTPLPIAPARALVFDFRGMGNFEISDISYSFGGFNTISSLHNTTRIIMCRLTLWREFTQDVKSQLFDPVVGPDSNSPTNNAGYTYLFSDWGTRIDYFKDLIEYDELIRVMPNEPIWRSPRIPWRFQVQDKVVLAMTPVYDTATWGSDANAAVEGGYNNMAHYALYAGMSILNSSLDTAIYRTLNVQGRVC